MSPTSLPGKSWKVNNTIHTIMPILIIPSLSSLALGMLYIYVLAAPLGAFMDWLTSLLSSLQDGSAVVLGIVIERQIKTYWNFKKSIG